MTLSVENLKSILGSQIESALESGFFEGIEFERVESLDPEDDRIGYHSQLNGISVTGNSDGTVTSVSLFNSDDFGRIDDSLLDGITLNQGRDSARAAFGEVQKNGGGEEHDFFGWIPHWDKFHVSSECELHLEYGRGEESITLMQFALE